MLSTSKIINKLITVVIVYGLVFINFANAKSTVDCDITKDHTGVVSSKIGTKSRICIEPNKLFELDYSFKTRKLTIDTPAGKSTLEVTPKGYSPELVGAEENIRILPMELQPYLPSTLLYISAIRTNGGDGRGQCGSGAEIFLNVLNIELDRPKLISKILVSSCAESIELKGSEEAGPNLKGFSISNGELKVHFLFYKNENGSRTATLSKDFKRLEFLNH